MSEGTNGLPRELEERLVEAKDWYDKRDLRAWDRAGNVQAEHDSDAEGAQLLISIIEIIDGTWGWAPKLKKAGD